MNKHITAVLEKLTNCRHYMLDMETYHTQPSVGEISSLALQPFFIHTDGSCEILDTNLHVRIKVGGLNLGRTQNPETVEWRKQHKVSIREAQIKTAIEGSELAERISHYLNLDSSPNVRRLWAMPTTFDIAFLQAYWEATPTLLPFPVHYRNTLDLRSFVTGLGLQLEDCYAAVPDRSRSHDALVDCNNQIKYLECAIQFAAAN